jgi:hypothetical protein
MRELGNPPPPEQLPNMPQGNALMSGAPPMQQNTPMGNGAPAAQPSTTTIIGTRAAALTGRVSASGCRMPRLSRLDSGLKLSAGKHLHQRFILPDQLAISSRDTGLATSSHVFLQARNRTTE